MRPDIAIVPLVFTLEAKPPYTYHSVRVTRSPYNDRLRVEVESFEIGNLGPVRIEMAMLEVLSHELHRRYGCPASRILDELRSWDYPDKVIGEAARDLIEGLKVSETIEQTEGETV